MSYEMKIRGKFPKGDYIEGMTGEEYVKSSFDKFKYWGGQYLCQEKIDGWHGIIIKENGKSYWDQDWREYSVLQNMLKEINYILPNNTIICGEVNYGTNHATEQYNKTGYHTFTMFDIIKWNGLSFMDVPAMDRFSVIEDIYELLNRRKESYFLKIAKTIILKHSEYNNKQRAWEMFQKVTSDGGEGLVLKKLTSKYLKGQESKELYKIKRYITKDYTCMGFESHGAPTYISKGITVSNMVCGLYNKETNKIHKVTKTSGFNEYWRKKFTDDPNKYIGRVVELGGFELFKSGAIRHSQFLRFREDKKSQECIF